MAQITGNYWYNRGQNPPAYITIKKDGRKKLFDVHCSFRYGSIREEEWTEEDIKELIDSKKLNKTSGGPEWD